MGGSDTTWKVNYKEGIFAWWDVCLYEDLNAMDQASTSKTDLWRDLSQNELFIVWREIHSTVLADYNSPIIWWLRRIFTALYRAPYAYKKDIADIKWSSNLYLYNATAQALIEGEEQKSIWDLLVLVHFGLVQLLCWGRGQYWQWHE